MTEELLTGRGPEFVKKKDGCLVCPLNLQGMVPPEGDLESAKLVIVGQNPGTEEIRRRRPFIGPCGTVVFPALEAVTGLKREDCYITNSCKCWNPSDTTTDPPPDVFACCGKQWSEEWAAIQGKRVLLLGAWASRRFFRSFTKRGLYRYKDNSVFLEMYHPAWVLYGGSREVWDRDLELLRPMLRWTSNRMRRVFHEVIQLPGQIEESVSYFMNLAEDKIVAFDIETTALSPFYGTSRILCISFSDGIRTHVYDWEQLGGLARDAAKRILESPVRKVAQNGKFDMTWLRKEGIFVKNFYLDPMVAQFLLEGGMSGSVSLTQMIMQYLPEFAGWGEDVDYKNMADVPKEILYHYNAVDSFTTVPISYILEKRLKDEGMWELFSSILMPAEMALTEAEFNGMHFDVGKVVSEKERLGSQMAAIVERIRAVAEPYGMSEGMNIDSLYWLRELMFDKLKLTPLRRTAKKGNPSLNVESLEQYATGGLQLAQDVLEWRGLNKVKSTYYDSYVNLIQGDGLIHPSFNMTIVTTGRLSCWSPNIQNVPYEVRKVFVSRFPGGRILEADFRQIEMRVMAIVSGDQKLLQCFREGRDPHAETASAVTGIPIETIIQTRHESRQDAKITNFSILYGATAQALALRMGDWEKANRFFNGFFNHYSGIARWQERQWEEAQRTGIIISPLGRKWDLRYFKVEERRNRSFNFAIQATASDITLYVMGCVVELMRHFNMQSKFVATVHDSMVFDVPPGEEEFRLKQLLTSVVMTLPDVFSWMIVPMELDFKFAVSWGG